MPWGSSPAQALRKDLVLLNPNLTNASIVSLTPYNIFSNPTALLTHALNRRHSPPGSVVRLCN